ncbi:hypothetical protein EON65_41340 [archaeon]|nr:MAG: hypothetical protein EON65_41340 [archaeon]
MSCRYDHQERLTAQEAMMHPYFDPVREACHRAAQAQVQRVNPHMSVQGAAQGSRVVELEDST